MATYLVACFNGADRPMTEDYRRVDAQNELAAAIKACGGEPLIEAGKPDDLRALVHFSPPKGHPKSFFRSPQPVPRRVGA
jgi:hypothetical protein